MDIALMVNRRTVTMLLRLFDFMYLNLNEVRHIIPSDGSIRITYTDGTDETFYTKCSKIRAMDEIDRLLYQIAHAQEDVIKSQGRRGR